LAIISLINVQTDAVSCMLHTVQDRMLSWCYHCAQRALCAK